MFVPSSFNGTTVNGSTAYLVGFPVGGNYSTGYELSLTPQDGDIAYLGGTAVEPRELVIQVRPGPGAPSSNHEWLENAQGLFAPGPTVKSFRMTWRAVTVELMVRVRRTSLRPGPRKDDSGRSVLDVTLVAVDPIWRDVTENSDSMSPATVGGNTPALGKVEITPTGTTVRHARVTITDQLGIGGYALPVIASFNGSGVSASAATNFIAFSEGREIPIQVDDPGSNPTRVLFVADFPQAGVKIVDIFFGSSVSNSVTSSAALLGGLALGDSSISNANIVWDTFEVSEHPERKLTWRPFRLGGHATGGYVDLTSEGTSSLTFSVVAGDAPDEYYDCLYCVTGSSLAGISNALTGLRRAYNGDDMAANHDQVEIFVKIQPLGATDLVDAYTATLNANAVAANVDTAVDVDNALVLFVGMRLVTFNTQRRTLTLSAVPATDFALALANNPSVSVSSPATARRLHGTYQITNGDSIVFDNVFILDGTLTIDALTRTISAPSDILCGRDIRFSNDRRWLELTPGSVAWSDVSDTGSTLKWRNAFSG